jgi:hypothetical protein
VLGSPDLISFLKRSKINKNKFCKCSLFFPMLGNKKVPECT